MYVRDQLGGKENKLANRHILFGSLQKQKVVKKEKKNLCSTHRGFISHLGY